MKKNTIKAFTLVEMLIVIVIIGILIASLMPRMQSAQGRARDVARKNDLAQIQTAIITSQQDKGSRPDTGDQATNGMPISDITQQLLSAGMSSVPQDPNRDNAISGLGTAQETGQYLYMVTKRNGVPKGGFVLMAKTEVEGGSNWVVCSNGSGTIPADKDLKDITLCKSFTDNTNGDKTCTPATKENDGACAYGETAELRYILLY